MGQPVDTGQITRMLRKWSSGDPTVAENLTPIVYGELRRLAEAYMHDERSGHTLQPTALIHEAYLRLVTQKQPDWDSRSHFFGFAARLMRHILVDHARARLAAKRGGVVHDITLTDFNSGVPERIVDLLALDEALNRLAEIDERRARALELRYFGGLTESETAETLGVSVATVRRHVKLAEAWLYREISGKKV